VGTNAVYDACGAQSRFAEDGRCGSLQFRTRLYWLRADRVRLTNVIATGRYRRPIVLYDEQLTLKINYIHTYPKTKYTLIGIVIL